MKVITLSGKAQHGKDTTAGFIREIAEPRGIRVITIHLADYLKYIAKQYYGWNGKKNIKGRTLLQKLGTEKIRKKNPLFWVNNVVRTLKVLEDDFDLALIPDTRYPDEIDGFSKNFFTFNVKVVRENFTSSLTLEQQNHLSEVALDSYNSFDYIARANSGDLDKLKSHAEIILTEALK